MKKLFRRKTLCVFTLILLLAAMLAVPAAAAGNWRKKGFPEKNCVR